MSYNCPGGLDCLEQQICNTNELCTEGYFCPGYTIDAYGSLLSGQVPHMCPAGWYCPTPTTPPMRCPQGYFCPKGTAQPVKCQLLAYCPSGSEHQVFYLAFAIVFITFFAAVLAFLAFRSIRDLRREARNQRRRSSHHRSHTHSQSHVQTDDILEIQDPARSICENNDHGFDNDNDNAEDEDCEIGDANDEVGGDCIDCGLDVVFQGIECRLGSSVLIESASGRFAPGKCTGILGPSGCGKTTLLNALLGTVSVSRGSIVVNGSATTLASHRRSISYVPQTDILIPCLTVKETLLHAARTQSSPPTLSQSQSQSQSQSKKVHNAQRLEMLVTNVLRILGLYDVRHAVVGDAENRGISGGERKRVCIGIALVAQPALLILDEPTTGLDATVAKEIIACLCRIASSSSSSPPRKGWCRKQTTVVAVLHQPRFEIFEMLDAVLLLAKKGRTAYFGPASESLAYFTATLGYNIPHRCNPSDFFLDVLATAPLFPAFPLDVTIKSPPAASHDVMKASSTSTTSGSFFGQMVAFGRRAAIQKSRDTVSLVISTSMHVLAGASLGSVFSSSRGFQLYTPPVSESEAQKCPLIIRERCMHDALQQSVLENIIFFVLMILGGCGIISSLSTFGDEILVYRREAASSRVRCSAYVIAKTLLDIPFLVFNAVLFAALLYMFLDPHASFAGYLAVCLLVDYCAYGVGYLVSLLVRRSSTTIVGVVCAVILAVCAGTHPPLAQIKRFPPLYALWCLSFQRWTGEFLFVHEVQSYAAQGSDVSQSLANVGFKQEHSQQLIDIAAAFAIGTTLRLAAFAILWLQHRKTRVE
eukprot:ANDGO_07789.mRNA.1 Putative white-brown complex homolog protein 30